MRPVTTVNSDESLDIVLRKSRGRFDMSSMMVVVSRENGKMSGIVTPEDTVKKLFG
jgi:CBS domain containing-hemolysin-like protein